MNLIGICLAALISVTSAALDVERTVKQVQTILQSNSQLPRLSRDEIIELLNDIRAEDAKSKSSSTEHSYEAKEATTKPYNSFENEINATYDLQDNIAADKKEYPVYVTAPTTQATKFTTKSEPSVMVVLPYTPRDGSSLQELYTRPPRVEVVPESKVTTKPFNANEKLKETLHSNAKLANQKKLDVPAELQAFLDSHGLKGMPGQDSFLLPLEGFKPLPPANVVDGSVQLPENILLTYDLITPTDSKKPLDSSSAQSASPFLYEPLRPEFPFELDTSSSEQEKLVLPLDMPKSRKTKSTVAPNYAPIDYDAIKVIPLIKGPNPVEDERATLGSEQNKRQTNSTEAPSTDDKEETTTVVGTDDFKAAITNPSVENDSAAADSDAGQGASITDLEDSFGGAAPSQPGDSELPPPKKNGFYWMLDWNSFLEVGDGDSKVNIRFEPKLGDPQMFIPVNVP